MTQKDKLIFSKRFTFDDWGWLCTLDEFIHALDNGTRVEAATLAALMLASRRQYGIWKGEVEDEPSN